MKKTEPNSTIHIPYCLWCSHSLILQLPHLLRPLYPRPLNFLAPTLLIRLAMIPSSMSFVDKHFAVSNETDFCMILNTQIVQDDEQIQIRVPIIFGPDMSILLIIKVMILMLINPQSMCGLNT